MGSIFWNDTHDRHPSFHSMAKDKKVRKKRQMGFFHSALDWLGTIYVRSPSYYWPYNLVRNSF